MILALILPVLLSLLALARKLQAPPKDDASQADDKDDDTDDGDDKDDDKDDADGDDKDDDKADASAAARDGQKGTGAGGSGHGEGSASGSGDLPDIDALVQAKVDQALSSLTSAGGDVKAAVAEVLDQKEHRAEHEALKPLAAQEPPSRGPFWRFFFGNK